MFSHLKKKTKSIYFTSDILDELSEKLGKDRAIIEDIIKHNLDYVKKSMVEDPEIAVINFPNFGKLRFNYYLGGCTISRFSSRESTRWIKNKIEFLKGILKKEGGDKLKNFNKPMLYTLHYNLKKEVPRNIVFSFYKTWKVLEEEHNKNHEKYFK